MRLGIDLSTIEDVVILGSGGVTTALLSEFSQSPALKSVTIARRSPHRDANVQAPFKKCDLGKLRFIDFDCEQISSCVRRLGANAIIVQATSAPFKGDILEDFVPCLDGYHGAFVDLCYGTTSALLGRAIALDLKAQDGEPMLIEQARESQRVWFERTVSYDELAKVLSRK